MTFELGLGEESFHWMEAASRAASSSGISWIPVLAQLSPWLVTLASSLSLGFLICPRGLVSPGCCVDAETHMADRSAALTFRKRTPEMLLTVPLIKGQSQRRGGAGARQ